MKIDILRNGVALLPEKAIWLAETRTLVMGDLHFGKANHFRRSGLPVPPGANRQNAEVLVTLINTWKPEAIIFLGDLFHSHYNDEWEVVGQIVRHFSASKFYLVRGNHDIMSEQQYQRHNLIVCDHIESGPFYFTHEPMETLLIPSGKINVAGHIHPAVHLRGRGRQAITLPCFWLSEKQFILPAFGSFTGFAVVRPQEIDRVFVILENKIMEISPTSSESKAQLTS